MLYVTYERIIKWIHFFSSTIYFNTVEEKNYFQILKKLIWKIIKKLQEEIKRRSLEKLAIFVKISIVNHMYALFVISVKSSEFLILCYYFILKR